MQRTNTYLMESKAENKSDAADCLRNETELCKLLDNGRKSYPWDVLSETKKKPSLKSKMHHLSESQCTSINLLGVESQRYDTTNFESLV